MTAANIADDQHASHDLDLDLDIVQVDRPRDGLETFATLLFARVAPEDLRIAPAARTFRTGGERMGISGDAHAGQAKDPHQPAAAIGQSRAAVDVRSSRSSTTTCRSLSTP